MTGLEKPLPRVEKAKMKKKQKKIERERERKGWNCQGEDE